MTTELKVPTVPVEVDGMTINVPVGSLVPPTARAEKWVLEQTDRENWKLPTKPFVTTGHAEAMEFAYALDWYTGGHEITEGNSVYGGTKLWIVTSKGYYHYIGS